MKRALAVSLVIHGLFLVWALLQPPRQLEVKDKAIELTLFEVAPLPPPPEPEPTPPPEPEPPKPAPKAPKPPPVKPPPEQLAMRPPPAPEIADPPEQPEEPQPPPSDMPRLDAQLRIPGIGSGGSGLALPESMLQLDAGAIIVQEVPRKRGLHAPEIPKDLVGSTAKEALGRGRVARGMVHPYYVQLGKALIKQWDADRAVSSKGLKGFVDQTLENSRVWNGLWQENAARFAKSGNPLATDDDALPPPPQRPFNDRLNPYGGNPVDQQARREMQQVMNQQFRSTRRATIRVVQNKEGALTKVELVAPSNDEHVDQEALTDVRAAASKLPAPPPEALEGKEELSSLWSFELVVSITPPVPTFTFEFDEVIGFIDARMPLDRRIYKKVKLVSVE